MCKSLMFHIILIIFIKYQHYQYLKSYKLINFRPTLFTFNPLIPPHNSKYSENFTLKFHYPWHLKSVNICSNYICITRACVGVDNKLIYNPSFVTFLVILIDNTWNLIECLSPFIQSSVNFWRWYVYERFGVI